MRLQNKINRNLDKDLTAKRNSDTDYADEEEKV